MSENEQVIAIGRAVMELGDKKRKLVVMEQVLEEYGMALKEIGIALSRNGKGEIAMGAIAMGESLVPESLDLSALVAFVAEYAQVKESVVAGAKYLQGLGIPVEGLRTAMSIATYGLQSPAEFPPNSAHAFLRR